MVRASGSRKGKSGSFRPSREENCHEGQVSVHASNGTVKNGRLTPLWLKEETILPPRDDNSISRTNQLWVLRQGAHPNYNAREPPTRGRHDNVRTATRIDYY